MTVKEQIIEHIENEVKHYRKEAEECKEEGFIKLYFKYSDKATTIELLLNELIVTYC